MAQGKIEKGKDGKGAPRVEDTNKRALFRLLFSPMVSAVKGYELPENHSSKNPPQDRRVLRAGCEKEVLAMIGKLALGGETLGGYKYASAQVGSERIDYNFESSHHKIIVSLSATDSIEGVTMAQSKSFRITVDGDAPEAERVVVCARVTREVLSRDNGQLWVLAATRTPAPARPAGS